MFWSFLGQYTSSITLTYLAYQFFNIHISIDNAYSSVFLSVIRTSQLKHPNISSSLGPDTEPVQLDTSVTVAGDVPVFRTEEDKMVFEESLQVSSNRTSVCQAHLMVFLILSAD